MRTIIKRLVRKGRAAAGAKTARPALPRQPVKRAGRGGYVGRPGI